MSGQQILTGVGAVVGAVIGYYAGGNVAYGAELGAAAGAAIGGIAFQNKPRTAKINVQTNGYGDVLGRCWGSARMNGKAIWAEPISSVQQGGKGSTPTGTSYAFYGTFAVALCEGPIAGIRRIWMNGILVYDISSTATATTLVNSNEFAAQYFTLYLGDFTQVADPTMQAVLGAGNVPGYRGTAYMVFRNLPLNNYANVLPSVSVEVISSGASIVHTPVKVWENDSTGFNFNNSTRGVFITGFTAGMVRAIAKTFITVAGNDGSAYRLAIVDGSLQAPDFPNNFENTISSGGSYFLDPFNNGLVLCCPHKGGDCGVFVTLGAGSPAIGSGPQGSTINGGVYTNNYSTGHVDQDILAIITRPPGITGTWTLFSTIPCADWQHVGVLTGDVGGTGNYWLHLVSFTDAGTATELSYNLFTSPSDGAMLVSISGSWRDHTNSWSTHLAMLESSLTSMWLSSSPAGMPRASYFQLNPSTSQWALVGYLDYTAMILVGFSSLYADSGVFIYMDGNEGHCVTTSQLGVRTQVALSSIVTDIAEAAGLTSGQINATALTDGVWGFQADRELTARAMFEALIPAWWFDAVESDQVLKFVHRSGTSLATITLDDMGADTNAKNNASPLSFIRGSEIELPSQVNITYYAVGADFQPGIQYDRRLIGIENNNIKAFDTAAVMDDTQAAVAAAIVMWDMVVGRVSFKFSTSYKWAQYEPTDVLTIQTGNESYLARCTRKTEGGGKIDWEFTACAPVYSQSANGGAITSAQGVNGSSPTSAVIMDIAPLRDSDGVGGPYLYIAFYNPGLSTSFASWPGATLFKSSDGGSTFIPGITMGTEATVGQATTALPNFLGGNVFDELSTVTVNVTTGQTLVSSTNLGVLNGANVALIGNEILQFRTATLLSGTSYRLTGFLRGRFATEYAMAGHGTGEQFVLLGPPGTIGLQPTVTTDIGAPRIWDAVSTGQPLGTGLEQTITEAGNTLVCFSPVYLFATNNGVAGDISLSWIRRNRIHWQWAESVDVPMSEATEAYVVSIFNLAGTSVVRTINVSGTGVETATYTAAQQTTDFGGAIPPNTSFTFGVQQVSAITGAGRMGKVTLTLPNSPAVIPPTIGNHLVHFDGTNGSTTLTDVGTNAVTVTCGGSATIETATVKFGTGALNCVGTGWAYLAHSADQEFGSGDFTVRTNAYQLASGGSSQAILSKRINSSTPGAFEVKADASGNLTLMVSSTNSSWDYTLTGGTMTASTWHDIALVKKGTALNLYLDGTSVISQTLPGGYTLWSDTAALITAGAASSAGGEVFNGYLDELYMEPSAAWSTTFTPPTTALTFALMNFDGTNGSTTIADAYPANTWTAHGSAALSTAQSKFGASSLLLNGSTDYISTAIAPFTFSAADDWTIECFVRQSSAGGSQVMYGDDSSGLLFFLNGNPATLYLLYAAPTPWTVTLPGSATVSTATWHHAAAVKHGSIFTLYLDGVQDVTTTVSIGTPAYGTILYVGQAAGASFFNGYIDEMRVSPFARYTSNFTPPSLPFNY